RARHTARRGLGDWRRVVLFGLQLLQSLLELREVLLEQRVRRFRRRVALGLLLAHPQLAHGGVCRNGLIAEGLRERRLVALVVSVPAVPDQIDQEVTAKTRAVRPREARRA